MEPQQTPPTKPVWRRIFEQIITVPTDPNEALWVRVAAKYGPWLGAFVAALILSWLTGQEITPPPLPQGVQVVPVQLADGVPAGDEPPVVLSGWVRDPDAVEDVLQTLETPRFGDTPAGKAKLGNQDHAYLWHALNQVSPNYRPTNQGSVGSCVGVGWKHTLDVAQAVQIVANRQPIEWQSLSAETVYGGSRVQIGGGRIRGDGSVGAWAAKWCEQYGILPESRQGGSYSESRARGWGASGVPTSFIGEIKQHPVKGVSQVRSWGEAKQGMLQGYPTALCSDQGFRMQRDANGICAPSGTWYHCMSLIGFSTINGREYGFILNSWGPRSHTGPTGPGNPPIEGFYADANVIDRMLRQGDSFAVSNLQGFPQREIDWFAKRPERRRFVPELELALAP